MPEPSHGRSKSHWDISPRSSPTKSTPIRSSSPLFRFVRSSSPTFTSQSSGASASPSPTKSLHRYTHAPTFVQRFFSSTTQLDESSLEIPLTEHERGPRQRATSDLSKTSPDSRQILPLSSKLPVNLRNRRRSASLPSPGNLPHLVVSQPNTPASARPKKHLVGVPRDIRWISRLPALSVLFLAATKIRDESSVHSPPNLSAQRILTQIAFHSITYLAPLKSTLCSLTIAYNTRITDDCCSSLCYLTSLSVLDIFKTSITIAGLRRFVRDMPPSATVDVNLTTGCFDYLSGEPPCRS